MSLRPRVRSATSLRGGNGGGGISGPINGTSSALSQFELQEMIKDLRRELLDARAENKKVQEQLACLSSLVRRAWTGDKSAVLHVANIVGVAPPELVKNNDDNLETDHYVIKAQPKSRVLNNWARLTVGLLNRAYCHLERELEEEQRRYLENRHAFLEGQLEREYANSSSHGDRSHGTQRPGAKSNQQRVSSAKKRPTFRHLYRPANHRTDNDPHLTWGDVVPEHRDNHYDRECLLYKLSNGNAQQGSGDQHGRQALDYDDPRRYSAGHIYDEYTALGNGIAHSHVRPPSGKEQRLSDAARARPKSAVLPKGERPMKFETTRPIPNKQRVASATHLPTTAQQPRKLQRGVRPQSGKVSSGRAGNTFITSHNGDDLHMHINLQDLDLDDDENDEANLGNDNNGTHNALPDHDDDEGWTTEDEEREKRRRAVDEILSKIKKPDSVISYENDVRQMGAMEHDFKQKTLDLQRKLGIPSSGIV